MSLLPWLSPIGLLVTLVGGLMWFHYGDPLRKLSLSVRPVGLVESEEEKLEHCRLDKLERKNNHFERLGIWLIVLGTIFQLVEPFKNMMTTKI